MSMIANIDQTLEVKDRKIASLKEKVNFWKIERFQFSTELEAVKELHDFASRKVATMETDLAKQDAAVKELYRTIAEKEEMLEAEITRNRKLEEKYNEKDEEVVFLSTTAITQLQNELDRMETEVQRYKNEA